MWKFWQHGVTSSFLGSFLSCREQTRLTYVEGLTAQTVPFYFEFGHCMHWCFEQVYGQPKMMLQVVKERKHRHLYSKQLLRQYKRVWHKAQRGVTPTQIQLDMLEEVLGMAGVMLPIYLYRWAGDWTGKYPDKVKTAHPHRWISLEQTFREKYTYGDGKEIWINGRRDGVFTTKRRFDYVFDTKCRSRIDERGTAEELPLDLQQMLYLWVTKRQAEREGRKCPVGVVMNIVRRPGIYRRKEEGLRSYLERVRLDVNDDDRWDHYFMRFQMTVEPEEIERYFEQVIAPILLDVRMWWEGVTPHYMNPLALTTKYGPSSMYPVLVRGDRTNYVKRKHAFNELEDLE